MVKPLSGWIDIAAHLCAGALCPILLSQSPSAMAFDRSGDAFLMGYVASILERDLLWERDSYVLKIKNGAVTITLFKDDPVRREVADKQLRTINGVRKVVIRVKDAHPSKPGVVSAFLGITKEGEAYPVGDLFRPLLADPKQTQFFVSFGRFRSVGVQFIMASVGFGETFGMYRYLGRSEGDGLQFNLEGALFAQFNLETPSSDLRNADYTIGIPVTYRKGNHSVRLRIYHQSSHLGDELLQGPNPPTRVNLSFEAIEFIYSREWGGWRLYGGGQYLLEREPKDLKPASAHWGLEYSATKPLVWDGRPIFGLDMKKLEEHDWAIDTSLKAGLEFGHPNPGQRRLRLMVEWYRGQDTHGQFYHNKVDYLGLGVSLGF